MKRFLCLIIALFLFSGCAVGISQSLMNINDQQVKDLQAAIKAKKHFMRNFLKVYYEAHPIIIGRLGDSIRVVDLKLMEDLYEIAVDSKFGRITDQQIGETETLMEELAMSLIMETIARVAPGLLRYFVI